MTTAEHQTAVASFTPAELYARILSDKPTFILDVRNEDEAKRSPIEGKTNLTSVNIPYFAFLEDEDGSAGRVPQGGEILVVCAKEGSSQYVAGLLAERGYQARYLEGGYLSYGNFYDVRDVVSAPWGRIVQIARPARGDLSFAVISGGKAALIDPLRHTRVYTELVAAAGATLTHLFDTHVHADHISGGPTLASETGATYYVHAYDAIHPIDMLPAVIAYTHTQEGDRFQIGEVTITTRWFPGHTLGQVNYRLEAPDGSSALFTGDGIFLRSFGRPDLGGKGEAWTPMLYRSLTERLPTMADDSTLILPAHFSDLDEGTSEGIFAATYAEVKASNDAMRPRDEAEFTRYVLGHLPVFPPEYVEIKRVNIGLSTPCDGKANELELGKNICALAK
ncbi:MAG: MBL fold metallo-hydrolase [Chloroflexales bacterium]|nr:MBL fold metallo-hydrolase [Chloroflexales bacterium]